MPLWLWIVVALVTGALFGVLLLVAIVPRVASVVRQTPPPDLPENLAPGWYACCTHCDRTRTLASIGGIRIGGNRNASKVTLGWCRACRGLRFIRIVHQDRLVGRAAETIGSASASPRS